MKLTEAKQLLEELKQAVEAWLYALHTEIASNRAADELGARPVPVTGSMQASAVSNVVTGASFRETSGAATALVQVFDGPDATGDELLSYSLAANESARDWFGARGPSFTSGVHVQVTGAVTGALFLRR